MHDTDHAIDALRERIGLPGLSLDGKEAVRLVFDGTIPVDIRRIDATRLELVAPLDSDGRGASAERLAALLTANYLGQATGAARVALDPADGTVLLCERVDVGPLDATGFETRILDFVRHVALWASGTLDEAPPAPDSADPMALETFALRI